MATNDILELVKLMRHPDTGVPLRAVKSFLSRIPDVFTGEDLVGWLRKTYDIDTADEAIHLGSYRIRYTLNFVDTRIRWQRAIIYWVV